ncbi:hypothetical protein [Aliarcobacter butzleri]|uniref:hypothetical protein n=1 Tax=Aliarcobacter butzleri TaxID=28197 RepID=UPI002B24DE4E|nr:hypothetical protein [Aliarcobacter butzleri]
MDNMSNQGTKLLEEYLHKEYEKQLITKENTEYANVINDILAKYSIYEKIDYTDLIYFEIGNKKSLVLNYLKNDVPKKLANIIEDNVWKNIEKETILYHFTTEETAKLIEKSNILRLYNITKNSKDGEIKDFIEELGLHEISDNFTKLFYASFTKEIPSINNDFVIKNFRSFTGLRGARLKFIVKEKTNDLKNIDYKKNITNILNELINTFKSKYGITIVINGFSTRFASFYVNERFSYENEARLFINTLFENNYKIYNDKVKKCTYIELNLNNNNYITLDEIIFETDEEIFREN